MVGKSPERNSVLIPSKFNPACCTCVRSLAKRDVYTIVASEDDDVPAGGSRFCDEQIRICPPGDDLVAYKDALKGIATRPSVKTVLPLRPYDPYVLAKYRDEFERYVSVDVPPLETLEIATDRKRLHEAAVDAGVPVPQTWSLSEFDQWNDDVIIKSRYNLLTPEQAPSYDPDQSDQSGIEKDVFHVKSGDEPDRETVVSTLKHEPIVQEYVQNSAQYVFGALYNHGTAVATFQHRQIRGNSYTGGGGVYRESIYDPDLSVVGRKLLDSLDWHGIACIEFAKDETTGEYKLLEINPRFWQSLPCAVRAGADFPAYYWSQAIGEPVSIAPQYKTGVKSHFLYGEFGHLMSVRQDDSALVERPSFLSTGSEILISCLLTPHFDIFRPTDPGPFGRGLRRVLKTKFG